MQLSLRLTAIAKINLNIKSCEAKLAAVYEEIGRLFYAAEREGADNSAEIATCVMKADKYVGDIANGKNELAKLRNVKSCSECGAEININFSFCNFCGAKQEIPAAEVDMETIEDDGFVEIAKEVK